jgi:hypothetical protein
LEVGLDDWVLALAQLGDGEGLVVDVGLWEVLFQDGEEVFEFGGGAGQGDSLPGGLGGEHGFYVTVGDIADVDEIDEGLLFGVSRKPTLQDLHNNPLRRILMQHKPRPHNQRRQHRHHLRMLLRQILPAIHLPKLPLRHNLRLRIRITLLNFPPVLLADRLLILIPEEERQAAGSADHPLDFVVDGGLGDELGAVDGG